MFKSFKVGIEGVAPLICHNGQLADPLNEYTKALKEITAKRKKTDADHLEMGWREFVGGLYIGEKGPVIPCESIEKLIQEGARKTKEGKIAASAMFCEDVNIPIKYKGPTDAQGLWAKRDKFSLRCGVKVGQARVIRTRPKFPEWSLDFAISFDDEQTNKNTVIGWLEQAGQKVGLGDWRPKYGRFQVR